MKIKKNWGVGGVGSGGGGLGGQGRCNSEVFVKIKEKNVGGRLGGFGLGGGGGVRVDVNEELKFL